MSSQISSQHFADLEFKSGAMMWFSSTLDTNSPWGMSFPLSVPVQPPKKEVGVLESKAPAKTIQQLCANEFVQVSSNQRWNTQNIGFGPIQPDMNKKTPKIIAVPTAMIPCEQILNGLPIEPESEDDTSTQNLYKTESCRSFEETGTCRYGMKCQFAHGKTELRHVSRHPKYKTEVCKTFHSIGTCPYGKRCRFIHIDASAQTGPAKISPQKCETKPAPIVKPSFETVNGAGWSNNWNSSFSHSTNVNPTPVVVVPKGLPPKIPVDQFSTLNISKEPFERRSRLGIFQQICS